MRSESLATWALSRNAFVRDRLPVPYFLTHECSDAWLIPSPVDADFSERSSLFFVQGYGIAFTFFGIPGHGGGLLFFPAQMGWVSGVHQTGIRSVTLGLLL